MKALVQRLALAAPLAIAGGCFAATPAPPRSDAPLYDPNQLPSFSGVVRQFTLTPRGDIDGFVLADGEEVKTPPHLSSQIAYAVRPGDTVVVHGLKAEALPLIKAMSVTDAASHRTVVDAGPPGPPRGAAPPPPPANAAPGAATLVKGRVTMPLHGPKGDLNGALLDDGLIVRLPPSEAERVASLLQPGQPLAARGAELRTDLGSVLDAEAIGASPDHMEAVQDPPPPPPPPRP